jgi:GMP synthase-like glutamine amidotransferase
LREPRLIVVDPSVRRPEDQGFEEVRRGWKGDVRLLRPALRPGDGPAPGAGYDADAVVVMGSAASVHDDLPWLGPFLAWAAPIVRGEVDVPLLGICFGHQVVGHLAGGSVRHLDPERGKRVGVETTRVSGSRLLPGDHELRVVVSHCEIVSELPSGFRETATRLPGSVEVLEHETRPVFGVQFHPEARDEFARAAGIAPDLVDARVRDDGRKILDAFRELVLRRTR